MNPLPAPFTRFIKKRPWLYTLGLKLYFAFMKLRSYSFMNVKYKILRPFLREHPRLMAIVRYYFTLSDKFRDDGLIAGFKKLKCDCVMGFTNWHIYYTQKKIIKALYQEAILCCVKNNTHNWWRGLTNDRFDSIPNLQLFLRDYVLRNAGDYKNFLSLRKRLEDIASPISIQEEFYDLMAKHYGDVVDDMDSGKLSSELPLVPDKRPFLIGLSVWGSRYMDLMLDLCFPSLLTPGNFGTLCNARQVILFIHTDLAGKERIANAPITQKMAQMGVVFQYRILDPTLLLRMIENDDHKYWHLGMVQSLDIYYAKTLEADYHLMMPDMIYSNCLFEGILRAADKGHQAIIRLCFSTKMHTIMPVINTYRAGYSISIPADDLTMLGIQHMHNVFNTLLVTNKDLTKELPNVHVLAFEGEHDIHLLSPHQTILYLDRAITKHLPRRYYVTLDSELDKIIPHDTPVYAPTSEDGMQILEVSPESIRGGELPTVDIKAFTAMFWHNAPSMAFWKFFSVDVIDPLKRTAIDRPYMSDAAIRDAKLWIREQLVAACPQITAKQQKMALNILQKVVAHPDAKSLSAELTAADIYFRYANGKVI